MKNWFQNLLFKFNLVCYIKEFTERVQADLEKENRSLSTRAAMVGLVQVESS